MGYFTDLIKSGRVPIVEKVTSLSAAYMPKLPFAIRLMPKSGSTYEIGDWVKVQAYMSNNNDAVEIPVVVGDFEPYVLRGLPAGAISISDFEIYTAPIDFKANYDGAM